jgi:Family of unknown function (DUF5681)
MSKSAFAPPSQQPANESHTVGYGRPPIATRFKPGQSGNAKGRPKGSRNIIAELLDVYTGKVPVNDNNKRTHVSRIRVLLLSNGNEA